MPMIKNAYDKPSNNRSIVNDTTLRESMEQNDFKKIEVMHGKMKVIIEFPSQSNHDEIIKQEVRTILASTLQEHLQKIS